MKHTAGQSVLRKVDGNLLPGLLAALLCMPWPLALIAELFATASVLAHKVSVLATGDILPNMGILTVRGGAVANTPHTHQVLAKGKLYIALKHARHYDSDLMWQDVC